jgi:DNA polymerase alpha subunit A
VSPGPDTSRPAAKKTKIVDDRLPPTPSHDSDDDGFIAPLDDGPVDTQMSDPAPSSPAAKVAERKAQIKTEPNDDDDDDMMEVAHAGAITTASVNIAGSRPPKKVVKADPYPSPASSSPAKATSTAVDSSSWNELTEKLNVMSSSPTETRIIGKIDSKDAIEVDGSLNFFWTDYTEASGSLCLFGKVLNKKTNSYVSCFVKVDNILRKLYFLPRQYRVRGGQETGDEVEMMDVYSEVDEVMTKMNVGMYKIKACKRKYAFEMPGIPKEAHYMKLLYPYTSESQVPGRRGNTRTDRS